MCRAIDPIWNTNPSSQINANHVFHLRGARNKVRIHTIRYPEKRKFGRNCWIYPTRWSRYQYYINIIDAAYSVLDLFQVYHHHHVDSRVLESAVAPMFGRGNFFFPVRSLLALLVFPYISTIHTGFPLKGSRHFPSYPGRPVLSTNFLFILTYPHAEFIYHDVISNIPYKTNKIYLGMGVTNNNNEIVIKLKSRSRCTNYWFWSHHILRRKSFQCIMKPSTNS